MGSGTPLTSAILSGGTAFLEVAVDGETLSPRQQFMAVPYALRAATAEQTGAVEAAVLEQFFDESNTDGKGLDNGSFSEGTADVDNDGLRNFADPDNDNDGLDDSEELAAGSDPNLISPTIAGFTPSVSNGFTSSPITVTGTNFEAGMSVSFGTDTPAPSNLTSTSFDIVISPQLPGSASVVVTRTNLETASTTYPFVYLTPAISSFDPPTSDGFTSSPITVHGTDFEPGLTVTFGTDTPAVTNLTPTSFDVVVSPQLPGERNRRRDESEPPE